MVARGVGDGGPGGKGEGVKKFALALSGLLSWFEHHPDTPRWQVPSPVRAHT